MIRIFPCPLMIFEMHTLGCRRRRRTTEPSSIIPAEICFATTDGTKTWIFSFILLLNFNHNKFSCRVKCTWESTSRFERWKTLKGSNKYFTHYYYYYNIPSFCLHCFDENKLSAEAEPASLRNWKPLVGGECVAGTVKKPGTHEVADCACNI